MATRTKTANKQKNQEEKKNTKPVCCLNCLHSLLHRYGHNPILAGCKCKPQLGNMRFPYEVQVASFMRVCPDWKESKEEKVVEQRFKAA